MLTNEQIESKLRAVVVEVLGVDPADVTLEKNFKDDLGADSLDSLELTIAFENELNIEISDKETDETLTFGQAVALVSEKVRAAPPSRA